MRRLRTGKGASEFLIEKGLPIAESTLGKYRVIGGGPRFHKWGRWPLYDEIDLEKWAEQRLGAPRRSTSEAHLPDRLAETIERPLSDGLIGHNGDPLDAQIGRHERDIAPERTSVEANAVQARGVLPATQYPHGARKSKKRRTGRAPGKAARSGSRAFVDPC